VLALSESEAIVSVENVARELCGKLSGSYLDVREVVLKFATEEWARVKETEGMKETKETAKGGKVKRRLLWSWRGGCRKWRAEG